MKKRIVCFGDSNTWGYNAETGSRFEENRWPVLLQSQLGSDFDVIEEGLCGRTTVFDDPLFEGLNGLSYLYPCLMSHSPLYALVIMLGTNDCKQRFSATARNIADGLKRLVIKAKQTLAWQNDVRILIIAPAPILKQCETSIVANQMGVCSDKSYLLADEMELVAKEYGCYFYDAGDVVTMNTIDFMHLTEESHQRLAEKVADFIEKMQ